MEEESVPWEVQLLKEYCNSDASLESVSVATLELQLMTCADSIKVCTWALIGILIHLIKFIAARPCWTHPFHKEEGRGLYCHIAVPWAVKSRPRPFPFLLWKGCDCQTTLCGDPVCDTTIVMTVIA